MSTTPSTSLDKVRDVTLSTRRQVAPGPYLAGDTLIVHASSGWPIALRDLVTRHHGAVLAMHEASILAPHEPVAYLAHEPAQLFRLTTYTGRSIEATLDYRFLTWDGWKPLADLCPSDAVATVAEYPRLFGRGDTDAELLKLMAYLTANGTTGDGATPAMWDHEVRADFEAAVEAKGDAFSESADADRITHVRVHGRGGARSKVLSYLDLVGVLGARGPAKFVPDFVFGLRKDKLRLFLNRMFSCDGTVETSGRITYRTPSVRMARQVQHLLARFGIVSLLRGLERQGVLDAVDLWIASKMDVIRFIDEIGFLGDKADRAEQIRATLYNIRMVDPPPERLGPILFDRVYAIEATECAPVYDLEIADVRNFVANDFVVHNPSLSLPEELSRASMARG